MAYDSLFHFSAIAFDPEPLSPYSLYMLQFARPAESQTPAAPTPAPAPVPAPAPAPAAAPVVSPAGAPVPAPSGSNVAVQVVTNTPELQGESIKYSS